MMIFTGFDSLLDVLTCQYVCAIIISVLAIIVSFVFSLININTNESKEKTDAGISDRETDDEHQDSEDDEQSSDADLDGKDVKKRLKNSPALMAELVIKASMTEEQKKLEQEVKRQQLNEIFKLMQKEHEKFGDISVEQVEEQMKLYQ